MKTPIEVFAPAKINLTLHVTGQRADGYHLLDSLVGFADVGDRVILEPASRLSLRVTGQMAEGVPEDERNLCWRAAQAFGARVAITLEKHLPAAAGIGGGSSDAAAVLRGLQQMYDAPVPFDPIELGADLPVCMLARAARMSGVGEQVAPVDLPQLHAVLANPRVAVPTPAVFKALPKKNNPPMTALPAFANSRGSLRWLQDQRNDLEAPAITLQPVIAEVLKQLSFLEGQWLTRMSGSGATCFALFDTEEAAQDAAELLAMTRSDWWSAAARLS